MSAQHQGHPPPDSARGCPLLVVIDPVARRADGESVRIARDVLSAGASAKICLPDGPEEVARALAHRGRRRTVVIGDDLALMRIVGLLHRERELADAALSLIPVGASEAAVALARTLGVPTGAVEAARTVLDGAERRLDLLVDDSDGVVLGGLRIPALPASAAQRHPGGPLAVWDDCWSFIRALGRSRPGVPGPGGAAAGSGGGARAAPSHRLRVEADGVLLADLDRPVRQVRVTADKGLADVVVRPGPGAGGDGDGGPVRARARTVTVSGADFRYRADTQIGGPVRTRTWTVRPGAWSLMLPRQGG